MDKYVPPRKPHIPKDLPIVLKDLTREILRAQPADVYNFAVSHFTTRIAERGRAPPPPAPAPEPAAAPLPSAREEAPPPKSVREDMRIAAFHTRLGTRHPISEDQYCLIEDVAQRAAAEGIVATGPLPEGVRFFGVFDGHGGLATAQFAAQTLWQRLVASPAFPAADYAQALEDAFRETEAALEPHLVGCDAMGTGACAVCAVVAGGKAYIANLGDSRCILARGGDGNPSAVGLTTDHKVTEPSEARRLRESGAIVHMNRLLGVLAVARSLGDFEIKKAARDATDPLRSVLLSQPEIRVHDIVEGDRYLVLASDGVWDALSSDTAAELAICTAEDTRSIKKAAERIVESAAKTSDDDITAIVVPV